MQQNGDALEYASAELQADREVVLAAVQQDGRALEHASAELRADREVVLAAVHSYGRALKHAPAELKADREVMLYAMQQYGYPLQFASTELRADREVLLACKLYTANEHDMYAWCFQYAKDTPGLRLIPRALWQGKARAQVFGHGPAEADVR